MVYLAKNQLNFKKAMRVVVQRVKSSSVRVEGVQIGVIEKGLMLLVGFGAKDDQLSLMPMAKKIANLRIFSDKFGRFQHSAIENDLPVLAVPQFTLYADVTKGRRPEFFTAKPSKEASELFDSFIKCLREVGIKNVECGQFGAKMEVELINDGPVTIILDSQAL